MLFVLRKMADGLIALSAMIGTLALIGEVCVILADVVGRYFGSPLRGAQDVSQMGMVIIVFGGMALCDKLGGHVAVDVFERAYPAFLNRAIDIVAATERGVTVVNNPGFGKVAGEYMAKAMGDPGDVALYKRAFGHTSTESEVCIY